MTKKKRIYIKIKQTDKQIMIILACVWSTLGWVSASSRNTVNIHLSCATNHTLNIQESLHDLNTAERYPRRCYAWLQPQQAWHIKYRHTWSYVGETAMETDSDQSNWIELGSDPKPSSLDKQ